MDRSGAALMLILSAVVVSGVSGASKTQNTSNIFKLTLLHTNDMHSHIEQVSQTKGKCSEKEAKNNQCYGGFARLETALKREIADSEEKNISVLSLNAGDNFQGTIWYSMFKWKVVEHFFNMLSIDVQCLGNHEFDDGIQGLVPYLNSVNKVIVSGNIDLSPEPEMEKTPLTKHWIVEKDGRKIGIVGYITPETASVSNTGKLKFTNDIEFLKKETKKLKKMGVSIIIALGHSGFDVDVIIAYDVPDVDVVVGAHTHTFLYTGKPPDIEVPAFKYPYMVTQRNGRKVAVVQADEHTKYLGKLNLVFDKNGEILKAFGNPILLDHTIPEDEDILKEIKDWKGQMDSTLGERLGSTKVVFDGEKCRFRECNLGNLITDAFIYQAVRSNTGKFWSKAAIAIQQGGGIRGNLNTSLNNGIITKEDVISVMPFFNPVSIVSLEGRYLFEALEWSVARYDKNGIVGRGEFLQVSGMRIRFNIYNPMWLRVEEVEVRCALCEVPHYTPLKEREVYNVIMPSFLLKGGDNFVMFRRHGKEIDKFEMSDTDTLIRYIKEHQFLYHGLENRIRIVDKPNSATLVVNHSFIYLVLFLLIKFM